MAEVTINNSPFHVLSQITYPYGVVDTSYSCDFHTGVDIVSRGENRDIFPVESGVVVYTNNTTNVALGVQVQIRSDSGRYWRYCHMQLNSIKVGVGQRVDLLTQIGVMGGTGNVSGDHLHLECANTQNWQCSSFVNPCAVMGIQNEDDLLINYNGEAPKPPEPPEPEPEKPSEYFKRFNWKVFTRRIRSRK